MNNYGKISADLLEKVRKQNPLVQNITNFVVMNFSANVLLAAGASPIMAHAKEEMEEMTAICHSLVLNIGTLDRFWIDSMFTAAEAAEKRKKPIVLDPVGAGATPLRTKTALDLLRECNISLLRGNASEIIALNKSGSETKGVDSMHGVNEAEEAAKKLAAEFNMIVGVSGERDLITDGIKIFRVANGHHLMTRVTGTGCSLSALCGAFLAVNEDPLQAVTTAFAYYGLAGELAAVRSGSPGTFGTAFIDSLYEIEPVLLQKKINIEEV